MIEIREYIDSQGRSPYGRWFDGLDARAAAKVATALVRMERGGLSFDAWYRNPTEGNNWYSVGDSKADVTPAVPEPSAVALFGLGWLAIAGRSRRRR